ncbi:hypothetical protein [Prevotella sp. KH2C16]|uniref:hypothetical protein n=1 Tax=Prevotella sp. KH2C16 TaxID=1855325 RepID=UPI0008ED1FF5|nr:hypothetical protein [Prevotella sp. KH2C16]SFG65185.1 hypothetical protein SAMN05216383_1268 [Prevotella sp. KH2C16]
MRDLCEILALEDEIRSDVAAYCGDCVWSLGYEHATGTLELELTRHLSDDECEGLCGQFPLSAFYKGEGRKGSLFTLYLQ